MFDLGKLAEFLGSEAEEEDLYAFVAAELEAGDIRKGLWVKAYSQSDGIDSKARAQYIKLRIRQLKGQRRKVVPLLAHATAQAAHVAGLEGEVADLRARIRGMKDSRQTWSQELQSFSDQLGEVKQAYVKYRCLRGIGTLIGTAAGTVAAIVIYRSGGWYADGGYTGLGLYAVCLASFGGLVGFAVAEAIRSFLPDQKELNAMLRSQAKLKQQIASVNHWLVRVNDTLIYRQSALHQASATLSELKRQVKEVIG